VEEAQAHGVGKLDDILRAGETWEVS
jgi:hypothetical protein